MTLCTQTQSTPRGANRESCEYTHFIDPLWVTKSVAISLFIALSILTQISIHMYARYLEVVNNSVMFYNWSSKARMNRIEYGTHWCLEFKKDVKTSNYERLINVLIHSYDVGIRYLKWQCKEGKNANMKSHEMIKCWICRQCSQYNYRIWAWSYSTSQYQMVCIRGEKLNTQTKNVRINAIKMHKYTYITIRFINVILLSFVKREIQNQDMLEILSGYEEYTGKRNSKSRFARNIIGIRWVNK